MQSYFPNGPVTSAPYTGEMEIPLEPQPIYSRKKGAKAEVIATYDAEFRAGFDRKITEWAIDFMTRVQAGRQAVLRVPALHAGAHPADPRPGVRGQDQARATGPTC